MSARSGRPQIRECGIPDFGVAPDRDNSQHVGVPSLDQFYGSGYPPRVTVTKDGGASVSLAGGGSAAVVASGFALSAVERRTVVRAALRALGWMPVEDVRPVVKRSVRRRPDAVPVAAAAEASASASVTINVVNVRTNIGGRILTGGSADGPAGGIPTWARALAALGSGATILVALHTFGVV
jgi:hypothetical protein